MGRCIRASRSRIAAATTSSSVAGNRGVDGQGIEDCSRLGRDARKQTHLTAHRRDAAGIGRSARIRCRIALARAMEIAEKDLRFAQSRVIPARERCCLCGEMRKDLAREMLR